MCITAIMLTRHLYRVDEVCAALMYEIKRGRCLEVAFWTQELIDSEFYDELFRALRFAWMWYLGIGRLEALRQLAILEDNDEELSDDQVVSLACAMASSSSSSRDASVFSLLCLGATDEEQPDRINIVQHKSFEVWLRDSSYSQTEEFFAHACWQGKARLAWDIGRVLFFADAKKTMTILRSIQARKFGSATLAHCLDILEKEENLKLPAQAAAVAAVCLTDKQLRPSLRELKLEMNDYVQKQREEWKTLEGRRKRRIFAIPKECLYWITERGNASYHTSNLKEVYCGNYKKLMGCPFWDRVLDEIKPWMSDEQKELFWDTYFPDDIPDEWSLDDQTKSHGSGILNSDEKAHMYGFARRMFTGIPSRVCWRGVYDALKLLESLQKDGHLDSQQLGFDELYKANQTTWIHLLETWNRIPVEKRILITASESDWVVERVAAFANV
jgi:hypothetical protein